MQPEYWVQRSRPRVAHQATDIVVNLVVRHILQPTIDLTAVTEARLRTAKSWMRADRAAGKLGIGQALQAYVTFRGLEVGGRRVTALHKERIRRVVRERGIDESCRQQPGLVVVAGVAVVPIGQGLTPIPRA
jgi:hypothetical protein